MPCARTPRGPPRPRAQAIARTPASPRSGSIRAHGSPAPGTRAARPSAACRRSGSPARSTSSACSSTSRGSSAPTRAATAGCSRRSSATQIADAVTSTKVDVWSGTQDKILRQLVAVIDFAFKTGTSPVSGLDGGRITLRLRLDDVNATTVPAVAPKDARPLSDLTGEGGLGALLSGLGAGVLGGTGGGDGGEAFLQCLNSASGQTADIVECASKLAPQP